MDQAANEILLRIFLNVDRRSLLNLRLVSNRYNAVINETPLGQGWEYTRNLLCKPVDCEMPSTHPIQSSLNVEGSIFNKLCKDFQQPNKKRKVGLEGDLVKSLSKSLKLEQHKLAVIERIRNTMGHTPDLMEEALQLVKKVTFRELYCCSPTRPVMFSQFVIPREFLKSKTIGMPQDGIIVTVEWTSAREIDPSLGQAVDKITSSKITFTDEDTMEWDLLRYHGPDHQLNTFDGISAEYLWDLLDIKLLYTEVLEIIVLLAMAGYASENNQQHLYTWWEQCNEIHFELWQFAESRMAGPVLVA